MELTCSKDPKKIWTFVQSKKYTTRISALMIFKNIELTCPLEIVNAFAEYFNSVFIASSPCHDKNVSAFQNSCHSISVTGLNESDVLKQLLQAKDSITAGVDNIPSFILKDCATVLAKPLCFLFKLILKYSKFPSVWKQAYI